jgi:hypothetical protein
MTTVPKIVRLDDLVLLHSGAKKKKGLTPEQLFSVPCPTCGVVAGGRRVLHSGAPRSQPHVDWKFVAVETAKRKSG